MIIEITINCETEDEIFSHLTKIRRQIKSEIKKQGGELSYPNTLEDSNCYGTHDVILIPECTAKSGHFADGNGFCLYCSAQLDYGKSKY